MLSEWMMGLEEKDEKRARPDTDLYGGRTSALAASRPQKDDSRMESPSPQDLSKVECYNCG